MTLLVRAADCVPVLLVAPDGGVIGAVHSGRPGLVPGVVPATVARMRELGAGRIEGWIGPHVCGRCYEVPEQMRADVAARRARLLRRDLLGHALGRPRRRRRARSSRSSTSRSTT